MLVVEHTVSLADFPASIGVLRVTDTRRALATLAHAYRKFMTETTVIAITGSAGKTTTKAILHAILSRCLPGVAAPMSFNNDIGVPLTILSARPSDRYLIVEIGSSGSGEIAALGRITRPDIAVITSIGRAHLEGLGDLVAITEEKASLLRFLRSGGVAIVPHSPETTDLLHPHLPPGVPVLRFGETDGSDICLSGREIVANCGGSAGSGGGASRQWIEVNHQRRFLFNLPGAHNATNALAAIAVARHMGIDDERIGAGLEQVDSPPLRMEHREQDGIDFFVDCYNANPDSVRAALDTFFEFASAARQRIMVLGDMLELGAASESLHRELGVHLLDLNQRHSLHHIMLVGTHIKAAFSALQNSFPQDRIDHFPLVNDDSRRRFYGVLSPGDAVLLKASRALALERLLDDPPREAPVEPKPSPVPQPVS